MNWKKSHLFRWGIECLIFLCYLALFAPWFILISIRIGQDSVLWLYFKLATLMSAAWALGHYLRPKTQNADENIRRQSTVLLIATGFVLTAFLIVVPALSPLPSVAVIAGYSFLGLLAWFNGIRKAAALHMNYQLQQQLLLGTFGIAACFLLAGRMGIAQQVYLRSLPFLLFWVPVATILTGLLRVIELQGLENMERLQNWLRPFLKIVGVCLLIAVFAGGLAPWVFHYLKIPLLFLWQAIRFIILFVSYWVAYVLQYVLAAIVSFITNTAPSLNIPGPPEFEVSEEVAERAPFLSPLLVQILQWTALVVVLLIVARLIYHYLLKNNRAVARKQSEDSRESFTSQEALREWGKRQLSKIANTLRQKAGAFSMGKKPKTAVDIYHALLALGTRKGINRDKAMTAHCFQPQLQKGFPNSVNETENIFESFVQELYAGKKATPEQVELLRTDYLQVKRES